MSAGKFWKAGCIGAMVLLAGCAPKEERAARSACTDFLRVSAKNPSSATIPKPNKHTVGSRVQTIEWERGGGLRFMNNMGVNLDVEATCVTSASGIMVEELYMDGKLVFEDVSFRKAMYGDVGRE